MNSLAHSSDEQRLGHPAALILFALGTARVPPGPPLPGSVLIALLSELGLSEGAARSAILRMRRGGWLVSHRTGRAVAYAPSDRILAGHRRRASTFTAPSRPWGGAFHALLVSVPEPARAFRDELRRAAQLAGYRTMRGGLLVAPGDRREEIGDILDRVPPEASVMAGWLQLGPEDTQRVVSELWELEELGKCYQSLARRAHAAAASVSVNGPTGGDALRAFAAATLPIYQAVAEDPGLPTDLLPPDWPAPELGRALGEALAAFGPAVAAYLDHLRHIADRTVSGSVIPTIGGGRPTRRDPPE